MTAKRKAAFPFKVGALGKTASETCRNNTLKITNRQRVKRLVVWLAVVGILPVAAAEWILHRGGMKHE